MNSLRAVVRYLAAVQSLVADSVRLAWQDLTASKFSLASNLLAVFVGLCFYAALVSISVGVGQFMESYYTRTMSLTTLLVYYSPDVPGAAPFTADYRERLAAQQGVDHILYHDVGFANLEVHASRPALASLRTAGRDDPETRRLEFLAGGGLSTDEGVSRPEAILPSTLLSVVTDLSPEKLIGREVALTIERGLSLEDRPDSKVLLCKVVGVVRDSPDSCVYLHPRVLAAIKAWISERKTSGPPAFAYPTIQDAAKGTDPPFADGTVVYPHLRVHLGKVEDLILFRRVFERMGVPTACVLDDVAAVRELRRYALLLGALLGGVTLACAACSIFNTLLASVHRRTAEIGILRALGAPTGMVLASFLLQGMFIATAGAVLSSAAVYYSTDVLNAWILERIAAEPGFKAVAELRPSFFAFPSWLPAVTLGVGLLTSILAGVWPAAYACRIPPTEALRHD